MPTQDMVLGSYHLTYARDDEPGAGKVFLDEDEVMMAYENGIIGIHAPIRVRARREVNGVMREKLVDATAGRIIFNANIPQDLGYVDRTDPDHMFDYEVTFTVGKKQLGPIIDRTIQKHGFTVAAEVLDKVKATGYKYSTKCAMTISVADMTVPPQKKQLLAETEERTLAIGAGRRERSGQTKKPRPPTTMSAIMVRQTTGSF